MTTRRTNAFTLIELVVAMLLVAMIAGAAAVSLGTSIRAMDRSGARRQAMERAQTAAGAVARDIERTIRDGDLFFTRVLITDAAGPRGEADALALLINDDRPVRPWGDEPEGSDREVQYRLALQAADQIVLTDPALITPEDAPGYTLWRRADVGFDDQPLGGGVVVGASRGVLTFAAEAFDGESWYQAWDSDRDGLPYAVRIVVSATDDDEAHEAVATRVIPLDRAPRPFVTLNEDADEEDDA